HPQRLTGRSHENRLLTCLRAPHPVPPDAGRPLLGQRLGLALPSRISSQRRGLAEPLAGGSPLSDIQREWYQAEAETSILSRRLGGGPSRPSARHGSSASAVMRGWSAPK